MKKVIPLIAIIALFLVCIWFKDADILGGSEDGLVFYKISNYFHQAQYTWMDYPGLGSPSMTLVAGKPTYFILSFLQNIGFKGFQIQAFVLYFLLLSAGIGMYLITKELFPQLEKKYIFLSILFYWFNPIGFSSLLNRSLLNYLFFYALLPVSTFLYIKGLRNKKYLWAFVLNITLLLYSYAFSYVAFTILFWFWLALITFYSLVFFKRKIFPIKYFLLNLLLFVLLNSWWVLPVGALNILGGAAPTSNLFQTQGNIDTLTALSRSLGTLSGIFKFINTSVNTPDALNWVKAYYSPILFIIQYFFCGIILFFIIKSRKNPLVLYLGSLLLTIIFLAKGNNPPFGQIYDFIFKKILLFQIFRNPFEKFSFLLSLIVSILLGPSLYELTSKLKGSIKGVIYIIIFLAIFFYLGFPLYSGLALTNKFPPTNNYSIGYRVKVPDYYKDVTNWLNSQNSNFRYIGFPIAPEGITYKWEKGYAGVELAVALYDSKGVSMNTSTPFFNQIAPNIEKAFLADKNFSNLANLINAKYYLLREDVDFSLRNLTDLQSLKDKLIEKEKSGEIKKNATFDKVGIWENLKWHDNTFYLSQKITPVKSFDNFYDFTNLDTTNGDSVLEESNFFQIKDKVNQKTTDSKPVIKYDKVNLTKYIVHIENISTPMLLIFSELYNKGWKATYSNGDIINDHLRANVYENAWVVEPNKSLDITIEFIPQKWMDVGEKISMFGIILFIISTGYLIYKSKIKKI